MRKIKLLTLLIISLLMGKKVAAQDFANLGRYAEDNEKLTLAADPNRIVFMGNSITEAWPNVDPEFFAGKPYVNRGISGQTTPQMLLRFRADVIKLKPKLVVILAGTNDIAENTGATTLDMILDNIIGMAELAKANNIKVVLCSVLPASGYFWKPGIQPAEKIVALNKMILQYAKTNGIPYVDYHTPMKDPENGLKKEYAPDGVHPNMEGYKVMEPILEAAIKKAIRN